MGSKNKLKRFAENETFSNVVQPSRDSLLKDAFPLKGSWARTFFKNDNPIVLELGCGKGEYTIALARKHPNKNFVGIDIKGSRFWRGAKTALDEGLGNVGFLRAQIDLIDFAFGIEEVEELWITFPDPQIKYGNTKHRLTGISFLDRYNLILKKGGHVHLKTDSEFVHGYTLGLLEAMGCSILYAHHNIYGNTFSPKEATGVQTFYEKQYLSQGKPITYLKFILNASKYD